MENKTMKNNLIRKTERYGAPRPTKKPPLVYKYNSAAGPFRKGFTEPGRNAPCPCGSGKKYKRCHLEKLTAGVRAKVVEASKKNQEARP